MHKKKDITKYNIHWQVLRVELKGNNDKLDEKLNRAFHYFNSHKSEDNWERCVNWLEGLIMGFRSSKNTTAIERIQEEIKRYGSREGLIKEENRISTTTEMIFFDSKIRLKLLKNLFDRNKKWLVKGYVHKELNEFMDNLLATFEPYDLEAASIRIELMRLRAIAATIPNTHKFFF